MSTLAPFAAALLDPRSPLPPGLRTGSGADPAPRLDVHRNNVVASLTRALQDGFPVTRRLVGEEFFGAMAVAYLRCEPPSSPVLVEYGAGFADFIAAFRPAAPVPYLADMARLERARLEAFHAADAAPLAACAFESWLPRPEALMHCRVLLHPSLRLLAGQRRVLQLWQAHEPGNDAQLDVARDAANGPYREDLLILRPGMEVQARRLAAGQAAMLSALRDDRAPLGNALDQGAGVAGFSLPDALSLLVHTGVAIAIVAPPSTEPPHDHP